MKERSPGSRKGSQRLRLLPEPGRTTTARPTRAPVATSSVVKALRRRESPARCPAGNRRAYRRRKFRRPALKVGRAPERARRGPAPARASPGRTKAGETRVRGDFVPSSGPGTRRPQRSSSRHRGPSRSLKTVPGRWNRTSESGPCASTCWRFTSEKRRNVGREASRTVVTVVESNQPAMKTRSA